MYAKSVLRALCLAVLVVCAVADEVRAQESVDRTYLLGVGDRLRLIVHGEQDLSGEFEIGSSGSLNLPLIGEVAAEGRTIKQLEESIALRYAEGYLRSPNVTMEVLNYRPFYILGEVQSPGSYPYVNGMTVLNAVALAGGFSYRARESTVLLNRHGSEQKVSVPPETPILPGDIITVEERFF